MVISKLVTSVLMGVFIVGMAVAEEVYAAEVEQPGRVQVISYENKPISWILPGREITTIEYTVTMGLYTIECVSIVFNTQDGRIVSHAYNHCTEHMLGERRR